MLKPGKLFEGESGLTDKRWQFWRQRIESLAKNVDNEDVKNKASEAAEIINSISS